MDKFQELLNSLNDELNSHFQVDKTHGCTLLFEKKLPIQLQIDKRDEFLFLVAHIFVLPAGKFREKVLLEALKINNSFPRKGAMAYSEKKSELVLFSKEPLSEINGKTLKESLLKLLDLGILWKNALDANLSVPSELHIIGESKTSIYKTK